MSENNGIFRNELGDSRKKISIKKPPREFFIDSVKKDFEYVFSNRNIVLILMVVMLAVAAVIIFFGDSIEKFNLNENKNITISTESGSRFILTIDELVALLICLSIIPAYALVLLRENKSLGTERRKKIDKRMKKGGMSYENAAREVDKEIKERIEEDKKNELVSGFLRILDYQKAVVNFYLLSIILFSFISAVCIFFIYWISQSSLYIPIDYVNTGQMITEGFLKNIRFFVFESMAITLLGYSLKRIFVYISMIEVYKEFEVLTIMDVQRQNRNDNQNEKDIVSKDFQDKIAFMLSKHYDFVINNKIDIKLRTGTETMNEFIECINKKNK